MNHTSQLPTKIEQAIYVYGFSLAELDNGGDADRFGDLPDVMVEQLGKVRVWYSRVDRDDYTGAAGEKNLANIEWLTPRLIKHQQILEQIAAHGDVCPLSFGVLFSSFSALRAELNNSYDQLQSFFIRSAGHHEWGLALHCTPQLAREHLEQQRQHAQQARDRAAGANYLLARRANLLHKQRWQDWLATMTNEVRTSIQDYASEWVEKRPVNLEQAPDKQQRVASFSLLSNPKQANALASFVQAWNQRAQTTHGMQLELTGPWPAYSFAHGLDMEAA
ncbi:GvpL/GvpF family gas vesicle protein [Planctomycetaceae bacterium SH139]